MANEKNWLGRPIINKYYVYISSSENYQKEGI